MRALILSLLAVSVDAASVSGTVFLRQGQTRTPLAGVAVTVTLAEGSRQIPSTFTDQRGRYAVADLPAGRLFLTVAKPGYFARSVLSGDSELVLNLASSEPFPNADFDVLSGGVITGRITGQRGEPLDGASVLVFRAADVHKPRRQPALVVRTDHRGTYRAFGLEPGAYILLVRPKWQYGGEGFRALYYRAGEDETRADGIQVQAASETAGIDLALPPAPSFRLTGRISGVNPEELPRVHVELRRPGQTAAAPMISRTTPNSAGRCEFLGLAAGTHILTARIQPPGGGAERTLARYKLEVSGDMEDFEIGPGTPARLTGSLVFPEDQARRAPPEIVLRSWDEDTAETLEAAARAPDFRFTFPELWSRTYTLEVSSPSGVYLERATLEGQPLPGVKVTLASASATVRVEAGLGLARLSGLVKGPTSGNPLPHARIAVATPDTNPVEYRTVQADQKGRFLFPDLHPGPYLVCAWPAVDAGQLYRSDIWKRAGPALKRFAAEPGAEVEIDLTAAGAP